MVAQDEPDLFDQLDYEAIGINVDTPSYWWSTSGRELARMISVAEYPEEAQRGFLRFFRDMICPHLGARPDSTSARSSMTWHGGPIEYSFDLKGSSSTPSVRFVVDFTQLRPPASSHPLSITSTQAAIDKLTKMPGFDDTWYQSLVKWFTHSHLAPEAQKALVAKMGHQTSMIIGFDIHRKLPAQDALPAMGKVYFIPCFAAAFQGRSRWQVVRSAIRQLPAIDSYPNILRSLCVIEEYFSEKPKEWEDGAWYLATDFVRPEKTRLKVYLRTAGGTFDEIWDFYTLGGRISGLDEDRDKIRELLELTSGMGPKKRDVWPSVHVSSRATTLYFSLSADSSYPTPKINIYPANFAADDESIIRGVDVWLRKHGMNDGGVSMEERLKNVFTHRELGQKTGIVTFIGIGRKGGPSKKDLSMQIYFAPEPYPNPRV
ncbi:aromatic prenyltransferase [Xylaria grammica]|nr:aromatic prenyltransferase [Xylaria grammica]